MDMRETSRAIDERAADWASRDSDGRLSSEERDALRRWLDGDTRRLGAFARAKAVLAHAERAGPLDTDVTDAVPEAANDARETTIDQRFGRRRFLAMGGAAAASVVVGGAAFWRFATPPAATEFATVRGEIRLVTLAGGSSVTLNTDTLIRVASGSARTLVELVRGEALFNVVAGGAPFIVETATLSLTGSGAKFVVSKIDSRPMEVAVQHGRVAMKSRGSASGQSLVAVANRGLVAAPDGRMTLVDLPADGLSRRTAWTDGMLAFEDMPLDRALAEFARYSDTRILLDDPSLARETVTGVFSASDPAGFGRAVSRALGLNLRESAGALHLTR